CAPSFNVTFTGCASTGAPFTLFPLTVKSSRSLSDPPPAPTRRSSDLESENPGARATFPVAVPVPGVVVVTVAYVGPDTFVKVRADPTTTRVNSSFLAVAHAFYFTFEDCASTGARITLFTVTVKD